MLLNQMTNTVTSRRHSGAWFAAPWIAGALLLYAIPLVASAALSLMQWDGMAGSEARWVGSDNYSSLLSDRAFLASLTNSVIFTAINVPAQLAVAMVLALLIQPARRRMLWATVYYMPFLLGGVATILIWWWLFNPQVGPINRVIAWLLLQLDGPAQWLGLGSTREWPTPPWLYSATWAKPTLVVMDLWHCGGAMLIFLAVLVRGGQTLTEAASLDGANRLQRFRHVTLPRLSPAILFNALTGVIISMQAFNEPFLLSNYQQQDSLLFYVVQMYRAAFERHQFGEAAAMTWVLLGLLLAFTASLVWMTRRYVHYGMEDVNG